MPSVSEEPAAPATVAGGDDYWSQSRSPLTSLAFAAPLLVVYEGGLLLAGRDAIRNGADAWLRQFLGLLGFSEYFLLPGLTVGILLGWHFLQRRPWRVSKPVLAGMAVECTALAVGLWFFWKVQRFVLQSAVGALSLDLAGMRETLGTISCYFGAGIYEELLFRLILLNLAIGLFVWMRISRKTSVILGILLTSLLFAIAHHVGQYGETWDTFKFFFRFTAGLLFAVLFRYRGFGIAAGTHAFYDVLVGLSRAS